MVVAQIFNQFRPVLSLIHTVRDTSRFIASRSKMSAQENITTPFANAKQWDATAEEYKQLSASGLTGPILSCVLSTANTLRPFSLATGIFDDGCGVGNITQALIRDYGSDLPPSARLLAADFSSGMVEQARKLIAEQAELVGADSAWKRVETAIMDAQDLSSISDSSLSHVMSNLCLFGLPDSARALKEVHRILVPGGVVAASGLSSAPWFDVLRDAEQVKPGKRLGFQLAPEWKSTESLKKFFEQQGFKDVITSEVEMPMVLPEDLTQFFGKFVRGSNPAITVQFGGWSEEELDQAVELAIQRVRREYGQGRVTLTGVGIIAGGRK